MTVYFTASVVGKKYHLTYYKKIVDLLKSHGINVIADHILAVEERDIHLQSKEQRLDFHKQLEEWIHAADFMVVESSFPSISVGYEISLALHRGKPALLLYRAGEAPSLIASHKDEKAISEKYSDDTLPAIIEDF